MKQAVIIALAAIASAQVPRPPTGVVVTVMPEPHLPVFVSAPFVYHPACEAKMPAGQCAYPTEYWELKQPGTACLWKLTGQPVFWGSVYHVLHNGAEVLVWPRNNNSTIPIGQVIIGNTGGQQRLTGNPCDIRLVTAFRTDGVQAPEAFGWPPTDDVRVTAPASDLVVP